MATTTLPLDQAPIAVAADEELAGPPHLQTDIATTTAPVQQNERVSTIDVLRGFSLMGILIMNATDFAYGYANYAYPLATVKPVFNGPHWKANTILWFARWILAEGKMRALFSILFGAGVILLTGRAESRGAGIRTADIYTRRNLWLLLFGMLHCFLIWNGDILFLYAATALIFLFPFRNLKPRTLLWIASIVLSVNCFLLNGGQTAGVFFQHRSFAKAEAKLAAHKPLTDDEKSSIESWHKSENHFRLPAADMYKDIAKHQGYGKAFIADAPDGFRGETMGGYPAFAGDWFSMMLFGMALFKNGFLSGKLRTRTYALVAIIGLGISWPLTFLGAWHAWKTHFDYVQTFLWMQAPYDIGRIGGALGNAAVLLLLIRAGLFKWLFARIANVGQMALSNYLLTSLVMRTIFVWSKLHWYGYIDYYKLYYVVLGIWTLNIVFSTLWLRYFRFGPVEWCWRSLTYWKRQPMRLTTPVPQSPIPTPPTPKPLLEPTAA